MDNWAIVVGINKYDHSACLQSAVNDALKMHDWLLNVGGVNKRNMILLLSPTDPQTIPFGLQWCPAIHDNLIECIDLLLKSSGGAGDRFYFYYSGHGLSSWMNCSLQDAIIPSDFSDTITTKSLSTRTLMDRFLATGFREQFFFFDACRNIPLKKDFLIGNYPSSQIPVPPSPSQYAMFGTSPGMKATGILDTGNGHGVFTNALLEGLAAQGTAKVWDDDSQEYIVKWDRLFDYVERKVQSIRLAVDGGRIQEPRKYVDGSGNPIMSRFSANAFPNEILQVIIEPRDAASEARIAVHDRGCERASVDKIMDIPVVFQLNPKEYSIRPTAKNYRPRRDYYPIDLYTPATVKVQFDFVSKPEAQFMMFDYELLIEEKRTTSILAYSKDPMAIIEVIDSADNIIVTGLGSAKAQNVKPGFYRARMRIGGTIGPETLLEIRVGANEEVIVKSPAPDYELLQNLHGKVYPPDDNMFELSEIMRHVSGVQYSTILALGAGAAMDRWSGFGYHLRSIGVPSLEQFLERQITCGLQILVGIEPSSSAINLTSLRFRCWGQSVYPPVASDPFSPIKGLEGALIAGVPLQPGMHWLSLEIPEQQPAFFSTAAVYNHVTLLVIYFKNNGTTDVFSYMPSLVDECPDAPKFDKARFPILRSIELIEQAFMRQQYKNALDGAMALLKKTKRVDPIVALLGGYLLIHNRAYDELKNPVSDLLQHFNNIVDSNIIAAEYESALKNSHRAQELYQKALEQGIPVFYDGLQLLSKAIERYHLEHRNADQVKKLASRINKSSLWSSYIETSVTENERTEFV